MTPPDHADLPPVTPDPPDQVLSLAGEGRAELRVQRSRFLAWTAAAADETAARAFIAEAGRVHHDARHVCWAWRLGRSASPAEARGDGGEPAGTAGEPILAALRKADLVDCVGVVLRWFGGIKLGTGGLARAYGEAAALALEAAPRREILLGRRFGLRFPYPLQKSLRRDLCRARRPGARGGVRRRRLLDHLAAPFGGRRLRRRRDGTQPRRGRARSPRRRLTPNEKGPRCHRSPHRSPVPVF